MFFHEKRGCMNMTTGEKGQRKRMPNVHDKAKHLVLKINAHNINQPNQD